MSNLSNCYVTKISCSGQHATTACMCITARWSSLTLPPILSWESSWSSHRQATGQVGRPASIKLSLILCRTDRKELAPNTWRAVIPNLLSGEPEMWWSFPFTCSWLYMSFLLFHFICVYSSQFQFYFVLFSHDSKVHGANMGPTWDRQGPSGSHVGHVNLAIWVRLFALSEQTLEKWRCRGISYDILKNITRLLKTCSNRLIPTYFMSNFVFSILFAVGLAFTGAWAFVGINDHQSISRISLKQLVGELQYV